MPATHGGRPVGARPPVIGHSRYVSIAKGPSTSSFQGTSDVDEVLDRLWDHDELPGDPLVLGRAQIGLDVVKLGGAEHRAARIEGLAKETGNISRTAGLVRWMISATARACALAVVVRSLISAPSALRLSEALNVANRRVLTIGVLPLPAMFVVRIGSSDDRYVEEQ